MGYWNKGSLEGSSYKYFGKDDVWFLCEFVGKKFNQCLSRGKGFPEGMPQNEKAQNFKDLTDMGDIIENSNEKLKEKVFFLIA